MVFENSTYNITALQEADTVFGLLEYANNSTEGMLMGGFMLAIFFVMLMVLKKWDFIDSLAASGFVCFILSSILVYGKLLNMVFPIMFLGITAFTALYMYTLRR